tara:strand:+ start:511 stop:1050 length:540 start_codon:yes stop_codon:yes gene_type:complete
MAKHVVDKIGILGGSFDPAHKGHLTISKIAIRKANLKKLYWIVTKQNPFKKKPFFSLKKRLLIARKIVKNTKKIEVSYLDNITGSSRSIDTIKYILKINKPKNLYLIIGSDILPEFHKWKNWKKIVKLTKLIVFSRSGYGKKKREYTVGKYLKKNKITFIKNKPIKISSSILRKKQKTK